MALTLCALRVLDWYGNGASRTESCRRSRRFSERLAADQFPEIFFNVAPGEGKIRHGPTRKPAKMLPNRRDECPYSPDRRPQFTMSRPAAGRTASGSAGGAPERGAAENSGLPTLCTHSQDRFM